MGYEIFPLNLVKKGYVSDATPPASQSLGALTRGCSSSPRETNLSCWPGIFPTCQDPFNHRHKGTVGPLGLPGYWGQTRAPGHSTASPHESLPGHLQHQNPLLSPDSSLQQRVPRKHTGRGSSALDFGLGPPWRPAQQLVQAPPPPSPPRSAAEAPACPRPTLGSQDQCLDLGSHLCSHVLPGCELCAQMHVVRGRRGAL